MKLPFNYLLLSCLAMAVLAFSSCEEDNSLEEESKQIEAYLQANNLWDKTTRTEEGAYVVITQEGTGEATPSFSSTVNMYYQGAYFEDEALSSSTVFDASSGSVVQSAVYSLPNVGFRSGVQLFKRDAVGQIYVPSAIGFGQFTVGSVPGGSVLVYDVEMVSFF